MAQAIRRSTKNSGTIHLPPGHANYNMSAKAYYNIHGYVTIHISIPLRQVYCNPPLRIPQYVFKYNYKYRCEVLRSVPMSETSSSEQDRSQIVLRARFNGDKTYDNRTEEVHRSQRTTYREGNHRVAGTSELSRWR